jgi:hypothetical protein
MFEHLQCLYKYHVINDVKFQIEKSKVNDDWIKFYQANKIYLKKKNMHANILKKNEKFRYKPYNIFNK